MKKPVLYFATLAPLLFTASQAAVVFTDNFSAYGVNSLDVNLNLPATDGAPLPTDNVRQGGTVGAWRYTEVYGNDADTQIGNATPANQAGGASDPDYMLLAYYSAVTCDLPLDDTIAQGQPLTISFDLGAALPPGATNDTNWIAFRLGDPGTATIDNTWPVVGAATGWAFLYRINQQLQVFPTGGAGTSYPAVTSGHFTIVLTDTAGTGSPFVGNGTTIKFYSGTTLIDTYPSSSQFSQVFMNFRSQAAFSSLDNLKVETGLPNFSSPTAPLALTASSFDFSGGNLNVTFTSQSGKNYQITHSTSLSGTWTAVGNPIAATAASTTASVPFTKTDKDFFRVEILP